MCCILSNLTRRLSARTVSRAILHPTPFHFAALHASTALQTAANVTIPVITGGESWRRRHSSKLKVIHRVGNEPPGIFDSSMSEDPKLSMVPKQQKPNRRHYNGSAEHSLGTTDLTHRLGAFYPSPCWKCFPLFSHTAQPSSSFASIMHVTYSGRGLHIFLRHSYFCTVLLFQICKLFQRAKSCFFPRLRSIFIRVFGVSHPNAGPNSPGTPTILGLSTGRDEK